MLPFPPLCHAFNNLNCYAYRFLFKNFFFTYHRSQDFFLDKFPLQEIFFWELSHHLRLFLMARPFFWCL